MIWSLSEEKKSQMGKGQGCQGADLLLPNSMSRKISYTDWRRPCTSDFSPGYAGCFEQWEMYVRILGAWLRRVDCIETKAEFRDLGTKVWEQMERNFASGATPKMIDLWIPKSSLSMAGK